MNTSVQRDRIEIIPDLRMSFIEATPRAPNSDFLGSGWPDTSASQTGLHIGTLQELLKYTYISGPHPQRIWLNG